MGIDCGHDYAPQPGPRASLDSRNFSQFYGLVASTIGETYDRLALGWLKPCGARAHAFFDQQFSGIVKALATLRPAPKGFVNGVRIAGTAPGSLAQLAFADGIADADIHRRLPLASTHLIMRIVRIHKWRAAGKRRPAVSDRHSHSIGPYR